MRIDVTRTDLSHAFTYASKSVTRHVRIPIMAGIIVSVEGDTLTLSAFDYEAARRARVAGTGGEPGAILVDAARFKAGIAALPKERSARAVITADDTSLRMGPATIPALPLEEYPALPEMPPQAGIADAGAFARVAAGVAVAAGTDDTLPVLTTVHLVPGDDSLYMEATDRYRLAADHLPWTMTAPVPELPGRVHIPARDLADYANRARKADKVSVHVGTDGTRVHAGLTDGTRDLIVWCLSGEYPRLDTFLASREADVTLTADASALADLVGRMSVFAEKNAPVRLAYSAGQLTVSAGTGDGGASDTMPAEAEGDWERGFNAAYLVSLLAAVEGDVTIAMTTSTRTKSDGEVITQLGPSRLTSDSTRVALLMPIRLS